jgi:hypothetical protein
MNFIKVSKRKNNKFKKIKMKDLKLKKNQKKY